MKPQNRELQLEPNKYCKGFKINKTFFFTHIFIIQRRYYHPIGNQMCVNDTKKKKILHYLIPFDETVKTRCVDISGTGRTNERTCLPKLAQLPEKEEEVSHGLRSNVIGVN